MAEINQYHSGAIVHLTKTTTGFEVSQVDIWAPPAHRKPDLGKRVDFDIDLGPIHVKGYVDIPNKTVYIEITIVGISVGSFTFTWDNGLKIKVNLLIVKGELTFYVKNGHELRVHIKLKIKFDGSWDEDFNIIFW